MATQEPQTFVMEFSTANAAFDGRTDDEIARILRRVADNFDSGVFGGMHAEGAVRDANGNTIGTYSHRHQ